MKAINILLKNKKEVEKMLNKKMSYLEIAKVFEVSKNSLAGFVRLHIKKTKSKVPNKKGTLLKLEKLLKQIQPVKPFKEQHIVEHKCKFLSGCEIPFKQCDKSIVQGSYCQEHYDLCHADTYKVNINATIFKYAR